MEAPADRAPWLGGNVVGVIVREEMPVEDDDGAPTPVQRCDKHPVPLFRQAVAEAEEGAARSKGAFQAPPCSRPVRSARVPRSRSVRPSSAHAAESVHGASR